MAQTPNSTATPYCSAAVLFQFHDWQQIADMLRDGESPRPTKMRLLDATSTEGAQLVNMLLAASGELESACQVGARYSPADLAALTGAGLLRLKKLTADLAFWLICEFRQPATADPKSIPGAAKALEALEQLKDGKRIFSFTESGTAGNPSVGTPDTSKMPDPGSILNRASRLFIGHDGVTGGGRFRG